MMPTCSRAGGLNRLVADDDGDFDKAAECIFEIAARGLQG